MITLYNFIIHKMVIINLKYNINYLNIKKILLDKNKNKISPKDIDIL